MTTKAQRLAAVGTVVHGADGEPRTIKFDFAALARVEDEPRLGSIDGCVDAIQRVIESRRDRFSTPIMADIRALLGAAMRPEQRTADDPLEELGLQRIGDVIDAIFDAWLEAWPSEDREAEGGEGKPAAPPTKRSRGGSSTTSRRSGSGATTTPSGE